MNPHHEASRARMKAKWADPVYRERMTAIFKANAKINPPPKRTGKRYSEETLAKMRESAKEVAARPEIREARSRGPREMWADPVKREAIIAKMKVTRAKDVPPEIVARGKRNAEIAERYLTRMKYAG